MKYLAMFGLFFSVNAFAAKYNCVFMELTDYTVIKEGAIDTDTGGELSHVDLQKNYTFLCQSMRNEPKARTDLVCGFMRASRADVFEFPTAAVPAGAEGLNLTGSIDGKPYVIACDLQK